MRGEFLGMKGSAGAAQEGAVPELFYIIFKSKKTKGEIWLNFL
jgi:hypothetical protein